MRSDKRPHSGEKINCIAEYEANHEAVRPKVKTFFDASYRKGNGSEFYFRPNDFPTIGADPDTKHGDSGAPTFDVIRNSVIGLLRAGAPDDGDLPDGANFINFELVIPISQIVAELDRTKPGWKTKFGVSYFEDP